MNQTLDWYSDMTPDDGDWITCETCAGDGVSGHDCGEDTCCCLYPEENAQCHVCEGAGGWKVPDKTVSDKTGPS